VLTSQSSLDSTDSVEQEQRLANLSWRLWPFVTDSTTQTLPQNIPSESRIPDLPQLSGSVESLVEEVAVDFTSVSALLMIARPRVRRQDSCASTRLFLSLGTRVL
jgi:hypothetical protein